MAQYEDPFEKLARQQAARAAARAAQPAVPKTYAPTSTLPGQQMPTLPPSPPSYTMPTPLSDPSGYFDQIRQGIVTRDQQSVNQALENLRRVYNTSSQGLDQLPQIQDLYRYQREVEAPMQAEWSAAMQANNGSPDYAKLQQLQQKYGQPGAFGSVANPPTAMNPYRVGGTPMPPPIGEQPVTTTAMPAESPLPYWNAGRAAAAAGNFSGVMDAYNKLRTMPGVDVGILNQLSTWMGQHPQYMGPNGMQAAPTVMPTVSPLDAWRAQQRASIQQQNTPMPTVSPLDAWRAAQAGTIRVGSPEWYAREAQNRARLAAMRAQVQGYTAPVVA